MSKGPCLVFLAIDTKELDIMSPETDFFVIGARGLTKNYRRSPEISKLLKSRNIIPLDGCSF